MTLIEDLYQHISALRRRAEHHRKQKIQSPSKNDSNSHLMSMTELTRQADELKAIVDRHVKACPPG